MIEVLAIIAMPVSVVISAVILVRAIRQGIRDGIDKSLVKFCPHGFRSNEICPTCLHFQKVREQT